MNKSYVKPSVWVVNVEPNNVLAASSTQEYVYYYQCPYIPEKPCREYNNFRYKRVGANFYVLRNKAERTVYVRDGRDCPYQEICKEYARYKEVMNERQR